MRSWGGLWVDLRCAAGYCAIGRGTARGGEHRERCSKVGAPHLRHGRAAALGAARERRIDLPKGTPMNTLVITQVAPRQWHALDDDLVVGRGDATARPDGRLFLSIDVWHDDVFGRLAEAMLAALPRPLYTVVDEADADLTARWHDAGLTDPPARVGVRHGRRAHGRGAPAGSDGAAARHRRTARAAAPGPRHPRRGRVHGRAGSRCRQRCCHGRSTPRRVGMWSPRRRRLRGPGPDSARCPGRASGWSRSGPAAAGAASPGRCSPRCSATTHAPGSWRGLGRGARGQPRGLALFDGVGARRASSNLELVIH